VDLFFNNVLTVVFIEIREIWNKATISPQVCCRTTLRNLSLQL